MYSILSRVKIALFLFGALFFLSCDDKVNKNKYLSKDGPMLIYAYEHLREYRNKIGSYPPSLSDLFVYFPDLKKELIEFDGNLKNWKYHADEFSSIIIEVDDGGDSSKLRLMRDGTLVLDPLPNGSGVSPK